MDDYFDEFLTSFDQPTATQAASDQAIEAFRGKLPDQLLAYWKQYGFCCFQNGLFCIVDPAAFAADMNAWIADTPIVDEDNYHVIARTAFGELLLWGEKKGERYRIYPLMNWIVEQDGNRNEISAGRANEALQMFFATKSADAYDELDEDGTELFERATAKWGPIGPDEVLAFEPALVAGGMPRIDNIFKRDIHVYLSILPQLGGIKIMNKGDLGKMAFT